MTEVTPRSEADMTAALEFVSSELQDAAASLIDKACDRSACPALATDTPEEHARRHDWAPWAETNMVNRQKMKQSLLDVVLVTLAYEDSKPFQPKRNDAVATWLKARRDEEPLPGMGGWDYINDLLDEYRLRADTGATLDQNLDEEDA